MKKIKIKNLFEQFKIIFQKFPLTFVTTIALTLFYAIVFDTDWISSKVITNITVFGITFVFSSFFVESTFNYKPLNFRIILYVAGAILSVALTFGINYKGIFLELNNAKFLAYLYRFIVCYILVIFVYSVYSLYKEKEMSINEYLVKTVLAMFKNTLIYGLLSFGLLLISLTFISLILEGRDYTLLFRIQILLFGLFYAPRMLFSFTAEEIEIDSFAKVVIKYVLGTLAIIAFAIIYLYMFKILVQWSVPSNQIFRITAGLFILGCPIWTLASYFKDKDIFEKINHVLPYTFIPFLFLQMYSIGIRIFDYGVTPLRYICVAFILFEIIYFINYHFDKDKLRVVFYSLIVIILVSGIVPYINMFKLSEISQSNIIKSALNSNNKKGIITDEDKQRVIGAYYYLKDIPDGDKIIASLLTKEEKEVLIGDYKYQKRLYGTTVIDEIDIEGYQKLYTIDENLNSYSQEEPSKSFSTFTFDIGDNRIIRGNIEELVNKYKEQSESDFEEYFKENNEYGISK